MPTSSLGGLDSKSISYSDLTSSLHTLTLTISQLEDAVKKGIVTKAPLEYIIKSLIQAGSFNPDSIEMALLDDFYARVYGEHLPTSVRYVQSPIRKEQEH